MSASIQKVPMDAGSYIIGGKVVNLVEWREGDFYDSISIPASTALSGVNYVFFRDLTNKEDQDSNINSPRRIDAGHQMIVTRLGFYIHQVTGNTACAVQDIKKILDNGFLEFEVNNTIVDEAPVLKYQSGWGYTGNSGGSTTAADYYLVNGVPSQSAAPNLLVPQEISQDHDVYATLRFLGAAWFSGFAGAQLTTRVRCKFIIHGYIKKKLGK